MRTTVLTVATLLAVAWCLASLWLPFGWDHGILAAVGDVILNGGMPYRDAWDLKGPGAYLWFALAQTLFGRVQFGIRVLDVIVLIAAAISLARVIRHLCRPGLAVWTAVALILWWGSLTFFFTAQPDGVAALLLACAFAPLIIGPATLSLLVASGLAVGGAALVKPHFVVFGIVPLVAVLWSAESRRRILVSIAATGAAILVPVGVITVWIAARGGWPAMIDVLYSYNVSNYSGLSSIASRDRLNGLVKFAAYFVNGPMLPGLPLIVLALRDGFRTRDRATALIALWIGVALALVVVQDKYFVYHWTISIPPTILLIVLGINRVLDSGVGVLGARGAKLVTVVLATGVMVQISRGPASDVSQWFRYATDYESGAAFYGRFRKDKFIAADQMAAADHIRTHSLATDRIVLFGYDAPALYLAGRRNATRFTFALPLTSRWSTEETRQRYRTEFMKAFDDPPEYVLFGMQLNGKQGKEETLQSFPQFREVLSDRYILERSFGELDVYRRKGY